MLLRMTVVNCLAFYMGKAPIVMSSHQVFLCGKQLSELNVPAHT